MSVNPATIAGIVQLINLGSTLLTKYTGGEITEEEAKVVYESASDKLALAMERFNTARGPGEEPSAPTGTEGE